MQDDLIDAYFVCFKKRLVERVDKKVFIQKITFKVEKIDIDIVNSGL